MLKGLAQNFPQKCNLSHSSRNNSLPHFPTKFIKETYQENLATASIKKPTPKKHPLEGAGEPVFFTSNISQNIPKRSLAPLSKPQKDTQNRSTFKKQLHSLPDTQKQFQLKPCPQTYPSQKPPGYSFSYFIMFLPKTPSFSGFSYQNSPVFQAFLTKITQFFMLFPPSTPFFPVFSTERRLQGSAPPAASAAEAEPRETTPEAVREPEEAVTWFCFSGDFLSLGPY